MDKIIEEFQLGSEYQDFEFSLEITKDRIKGYESYIYLSESLHNNLKEFKYEIELLYHWDILQAVIIKTDKYFMSATAFKNINYKIEKLIINENVYYIYSVNDKLNYKIVLSLLC
ncbi:hypothetical protein AS361_01595 [Myroides marinus]|uniref:hypothetical protein n=1 Tax=Myroides marinus TaxID=703342 RepID=UPI000741D1D1|nr:hypothetical protein [Myroides marinus]KUF45784.1 hypothetical protein AS361_01595 [Myroides marinus]